MMNKILPVCKIFFLASILLLISYSSHAATRTASVSGNWNITTTWGGQSVPVAGDAVIINSGVTVTVTANAACTSIAFTTGNSGAALLTISGTNTLTVSGSVTIQRPSTTSLQNTIAINGGTMTCASLALQGSSGTRYSTIMLSTGTLTVAGNITSAGVCSRILCSAEGAINVKGTFLSGTAGTFSSGTGTVNYYNTANQTIGNYTYYNLTLSGSGAKTENSATVTGTLSMEGTATISATPSYGSGAALQYNTATARTTGSEWTSPFNATGGIIIANSGTITMNSAEVLGASVPLYIMSGATLSTSTSNYQLTIGGDMTNDGTFTAGTGTVVFNGTSSQNLGGSSATVFRNLTVNNSAGLTLSGTADETINGTLTLSAGIITTGSNVLILGNSATVSGAGATSYIHGNLRKGIAGSTSAESFEIGDAQYYTPVQITFAGTTNSTGYITASTTAGNHPQIGSSTINPALCAARYWTLTNSGVSGYSSYSAVFNFNSADILTGADYNAFIVGNYPSSSWSYPTVGTRTATSTQATGLNAFGDFQLGESTSNLLPCLYADNGNSPAVADVTPCINLPSNPITVSTSLAAHQYFTMNVIKGLVYEVYTCNSTSPASALKMVAYREGAPAEPYVVFSDVNTGNPCASSDNNVYATFTAGFSGQVRVLINRQSDCSATTPSGLTVKVNVSGGSNTEDSEAAQGNDNWVGHLYDGLNFNNYLGYYTTGSDTFQEGFGTAGTWPGLANDDVTCFNIFSGGTIRGYLLDVTFSVRYRMTSTKRGLYLADLTGDDGNRLYVDGNQVYSDWGDHSPKTNANVLFPLSGNSSLVFEYYENGGQNVVGFNNLVKIISNTLTANTSQIICLGNSGAAIGADVFGTLPSGITLSGTGYQWVYSTAPDGARTNISGATGATYTPNTSVSPFNAAGTYYIYRVAMLSSANNVSPTTYVGSLESDAATLVVNNPLAASISYPGSPYCKSVSGGQSVVLTGSTGGTFTASPAGLVIDASTGSVNPGTSTAGTYTVTYTLGASGGCPQVQSQATVTVYSDLSAGIGGGSTPICYNTAPGTLTATGTGGTGTYTYLWYKNGTTTGITTQTYAPGALTATSTFYCAVTSGSCGTVNTPTTTITVNAVLTAAISGGTSPICYNTAPGTFTATGTGGTGSYTYLWYKNGTSTGITTQTYSPGVLTATSTVYCAITSGSCGTVNSATTTITVYGNLTASISGGSSPICYNSAPGTFTATGSGGTGTYTYLWYKDGTSTGVTTQTYTPGNLTATTQFYCVVTSGSCGLAYTTTTVISVNANLSASISGGTTPICYNNAPGTLTATGAGGTGTYTYLWYKDGTSTGITTQTYTPGNLTATSVIYCAVTSGTCGTVNTASTTITVYGNLTAGISGGSTPICYNTAPGTLTATGTGGNGTYTYLWYRNGTTTGITTQTYTPGALTVTSTFYCAITSGSCGTVNTSTTTITVNANLTASISGGSSPICYNTAPGTFTATGTGGTGTYTYLWYQNGTTTGITTQTYSPGALTATSTFYCAVTSGTCGTVSTSTTTITVNANLTASISGGSTPICYNTAPGTFTATGTGGTGTYTYLWYKNGATTGITTQTYAPGALTATSTFYCAITSGACGTVNTSTTTIPVNANLTASISGGSSPICYNSAPGTFTATGSGGTGTYTYLWYKNGTTTGITTQTYTPGPLTATSTFYCAVTSGTCGTVNTSTTTITVNANLTASISGGSSPLCYNTAPGTFTATGTGGTGTYTYLWYKNGTTTGITTQTYSPGNLTSTSTFYCAITSGTCGTVNTSTTTITVYGQLSALLSGGTTPICYNTAPGTFTATGTGGTGTYTYLWYKNGTTTGITTQTYSPGVLTANTTFYCAVTNGSCGTVSTQTITITVTPIPTATISYSSSSFCRAISSPQAASLNGTGAYSGGTWTVSPTGLTIDAATGSITPITSSAGTYTVTYTIPASGGCGTYTATTVVTIIADLVWTGAVSGDWNTPGNWSCLVVPDLTTSVDIAVTGNNPILSTGATGAAKNIVIRSGATLTVTGNIIQIAGTITNSGTFTATAGTIEMKGSGAQVIGSSVFAGNAIQNLTISNPAGVTLQGPLNVTGIVTAQSGDLLSGGNLTLVSSAAQTALIDGSGAGNVTGSVTMQRYLPSAFGYKYLSSPFQSATVGAFAPFLDLAATFPTFYKYDESRVSAGWVQYTDAAGSLAPMQGYAANFGALTPSKTLSISGTVNNNLTAKVALYNNNNPYTLGFNLVGNPYPSPVDWNAASGWTKTNIDNAIYFFDASDQYNGTYSYYVNGVSTGGANNLIASMQGFFIHVSNGSYPVTASFGMDNRVRVKTLSPAFHKSGMVETRPIIRLTAAYEEDGNPGDPAIIYFDQAATRSFDIELDALKMFNTAEQVPSLYSVSDDGDGLSINGMNYTGDSLSVIPLGLSTLKAGWVLFKAPEMERLPAGMHVYLHDAETGMNQDMQKSPQYRVYLKAGEYKGRFQLKLSLTNLAELPGTANSFFATNNGDQLLIKLMLEPGENAVMSVCNLVGQVVWRLDLSGAGYSEVSQHLNTGIYIVSLYRSSGIQSQKVYIPYE